MTLKKDLTGKVFNSLTVLSVHSRTRNGHIRYNCRCECGAEKSVLGTHLIQGNSKSCGCKIKIGDTHHQWNGVGEISGNFWYSHVVRSANGAKGRRRPVELNITKEYAWNLFLAQNRKCALSGVDLKFPSKHKDSDWSASLDRIDSSLGYVDGNVQWVHKDINMMKNKYDNDYFIKMCCLVAINNTTQCTVI